MTDFNKYHSAVEIKDITSFFLRRLKDVSKYVNNGGDEKFVNKVNEVKVACEELLAMSCEIANVERPPERIVVDVDRGINDFLEGCGSGGCGCDDDCNGGNCGGCGGNP